MKLIKKYRELNEALGLKEGPNGHLYSALGDETKVTISLRGESKTRPIVLPTKEVLEAEDDPTVIKFNPLGELIMSSAPSEVQDMITAAASRRIVMSSIQAARMLLDLILNPSAHEKLEQGAFTLIQKTPVLNKDNQFKEVRKYFDKVLAAQTGIRGRKAVGRFKLDRNVSHGGHTYSRACRFVPVCMKEFEKDVPYGIRAPKYAIETIRAVFEGVVGGLAECSVGLANDNDAPYFNAFLKAFAPACQHINEVIRLVHQDKSQLDQRIPLSWTKDADKMKDWYLKEVRIQYPGNTGPTDEVVEQDEEGDEDTVTVNPVQQNTPEETGTPVPQQEAEPEQVEETPVEERTIIAGGGYQQTFDENGMPVSKYQSPYARLGGKSTENPTTTPQQSAPQPQTTATQQSEPVVSKLNIQRQADIQKQKQKNHVHLHDAYNRPLFKADGSPLYVQAKDVPQNGVVQRVNGNQPLFDDNGIPLLMEVNATQQRGPMAGNPGMPQQPGMPQGNMDPAQQWRMQRMQQQQQQQQMMYPGYPQQPGMYQQPTPPGMPQQPMQYPQQQMMQGQPMQQPGMYQQPTPPGMPQQPMMYQQSTVPNGWNPHG